MAKIAETMFWGGFFQITRDFSFLDYILGGCQLMFTVRTFAPLCPVIVTCMQWSKLEREVLCEIWHQLGWLFMAVRSCSILLLNCVGLGVLGVVTMMLRCVQ